MGRFPLAYHITFGTYGTRLHGDSRGTVDRRLNRPGDPIIGRDDAWRRVEARHLKYSPIVLSIPQRVHVENAIVPICRRGGWMYRQAACGPDHVHVLLSAQREGKAVRRWMKRWLGEAMSARWPLAPGRSWWADGGSVKWIWSVKYLDNVADYIRRQRTTR